MNEEVISLREILVTIWAGRKIVFLTIILSILLAIVISLLVVDKKYESKATIQITSSIKTSETVMQYITGEFNPTIFTERLLYSEGVNKVINTNELTAITRTNSNIIDLSYKHPNPNIAKEELNTHLNKTIELMTGELIAEFVQLSSIYKEETEKIGVELEHLVETYNNIIQENELSTILIVQTLTPSETILSLNSEQEDAFKSIDGKLQNQLIKLQADIIKKSEEYAIANSEYQDFSHNAAQFDPKPLIKIIKVPSLPVSSAEPSIFLIMGISMMVGLLLSLAIIFFKNYWLQSTPSK